MDDFPSKDIHLVLSRNIWPCTAAKFKIRKMGLKGNKLTSSVNNIICPRKEKYHLRLFYGAWYRKLVKPMILQSKFIVFKILYIK
jgi:hypothetical protein